MPIIRTQDLCYTYTPDVPFSHYAVDKMNFEAFENEIVGIIGHTGSGKSTLIQHLNGLLKPNSGKVLLNEKDIWENPKEIRKIRFEVGLVFQYPEYQLFEDTVYKDIAFGPTNKGLSEEEIQKIVLRTAKMVGVEELLEKSPFDLSGGEKRRVALAGILAMEPKVLVLDEPTAGLDPEGRRLVSEIILNYRKLYNATVIVVSHNMDDLAAIADRIVVINNGSIALSGSVEEVFSQHEALRGMGLDVPHITSVFLKLREKGIDIGCDVFTVEQAVERVKNYMNGGGSLA